MPMRDGKLCHLDEWSFRLLQIDLPSSSRRPPQSQSRSQSCSRRWLGTRLLELALWLRRIGRMGNESRGGGVWLRRRRASLEGEGCCLSISASSNRNLREGVTSMAQDKVH